MFEVYKRASDDITKPVTTMPDLCLGGVKIRAYIVANCHSPTVPKLDIGDIINIREGTDICIYYIKRIINVKLKINVVT